jgi:hypothetical protein
VAAERGLVSRLHLHGRAPEAGLRALGLGHGRGAHAPDEYFLIEPTNPKVAGRDGAVMSYVEYLHELATIA